MPAWREASHDDYITMKRGQYRRQQGVFQAATEVVTL